jgi:regulator of protease activity HflC (stomatin/prohibitin superfamily)
VSTAVNIDARVRRVAVTGDLITFHLMDGRVISVPLAWSWRLTDATPEQRNNYKIIGDGHGVHWPDVDEDLSVEGMFHGIPARRPKQK